MATISEALAMAVEHHRAGRSQAAEKTCRQILQVEPQHADAWHLLGLIALQVGNHLAAVDSINRALKTNPAAPEYHCNLGNVLQAQGQLDQAVVCYRQALALKPGFAEAHNNLGNALKGQDKLDEAVVCYRQALALKPGFVDANNNLGIALKDQGKLDEAVVCYRQALALKPGFAEAHNNLGNALKDQRKLEEAVACYRQAIALKPGYAAAYNNLGITLHVQGKLEEAVACYRQALALKPEYTAAYSNLGNVFKDQGALSEALSCYHRALEIEPKFVQAHSALVYLLYFCPEYDASKIYETHRLWNQQHALPLATHIRPHSNDRAPDRRLRVGYVSPDFRGHVVGYNLLPLFREHDHLQFEIYGYANVPCEDAITKRFQGYADAWRNVAGLNDEQLAQLIVQDRIDILVDLTLHMANNRLLVFARKPAPVQVTFAGYPGTTGLTTMDYRLTDRYLDPPGCPDLDYSEESIRLPNSFWCYDPLTNEPAVNALPALEQGYVTFGCLNNFCKVNTPVLKLWAQILQALEHSRLILLAKEGSHRQEMLRQLEQEGITSDRITFVAQQPRHQYLELYHQIDMGLDTFPYNGHTTSLDSFWMGVPVVTLVGQTVVGRAGLSQLTNLGLPELIAETPEDFVRIAIELSRDLSRLNKLRATLRERMQNSPLMDALRFARNIEAAYRSMWYRWCEQP